MLDDDGRLARDKFLKEPSTCTDAFVISGAIAIEMIHGEAAKWPDELITTLVVEAGNALFGRPVQGSVRRAAHMSRLNSRPGRKLRNNSIRGRSEKPRCLRPRYGVVTSSVTSKAQGRENPSLGCWRHTIKTLS